VPTHVVATGLFWLGAYLALVLAPLLVLLIGPTAPGLGFWWDVSVALGVAGFAIDIITTSTRIWSRDAPRRRGTSVTLDSSPFLAKEHPFSFPVG
jgi:hypothetical protein